MNTLTLPNRYVLKALYDAINGQVVDGDTINVYDSKLPGGTIPEKYVLITSQSNESEEASFQGYKWEHTVTIECYSRVPAQGGPGSRVATANIANMVLQRLPSITIDGGAGLRLHRTSVSAPGDLFIPDGDYNISVISLLVTMEFN